MPPWIVYQSLKVAMSENSFLRGDARGISEIPYYLRLFFLNPRQGIIIHMKLACRPNSTSEYQSSSAPEIISTVSPCPENTGPRMLASLLPSRSVWENMVWGFIESGATRSGLKPG